METIITQTLEKLKTSLETFFTTGEKSIDQAEKELTIVVSETVTSLLQVYYQKIDNRIYEDKKVRKKQGLVLERSHDKRTVQTMFGPLSVERRYYLRKCSGYTYPLDNIMGISSNQRLSQEICSELVNNAVYYSYAHSSDIVTGGAVSKQTVMNKIRVAHPKQISVQELKKVPTLHIDADEDHVSLQNGKSVIVPAVTVYERIDKSVKRHFCVNAFSISRYGISPDEFWEQVYNEVCKRYDIEETTIYIHGDGAGWIHDGLDWFEGARFVLDPFHKNKALKEATAGMTIEDCKYFQSNLNKYLKANNSAEFTAIQGEMCSKYPKHTENILDRTGYLLNHINEISIRSHNEEAKNNGATEPHISHVLSERLSSRPMGWSEKTLKAFVPILAAKAAVLDPRPASDQKKPKISLRNTAGMVDPDKSVSLLNSIGGSYNSLYRIFKCIW